MSEKNEKTAILQDTANLVAKEQHVRSRLIANFEKIDHQRLYADAGFPSMFSYLTAGLKYSEPAAARRLSAARLSRRLPKILSMIESGELHLSGLHLISHATKDDKRNLEELVDRCAGKSKREIEAILAQGADRPALAKREVVRFVAPVAASQFKIVDLPRNDSPAEDYKLILDAPKTLPVGENLDTDVRIAITLNRSTFEKLERAQVISGSKNLGATIARAVELFLEKKDPTQTLAKEPRRQVKTTKAPTPPATVKESEAIPVAEKRAVIRRDGYGCSYVDPKTGQRCCATSRLEFDHVIPRALGGSNKAENLRLRCRAHNLLAARQIFGEEFIRMKIQAKKSVLDLKKSLTPDGKNHQEELTTV